MPNPILLTMPHVWQWCITIF